MKYEIKLYVYGEVVSTTKYDESEFDKMKAYYIKNSMSTEQYTQLIVDGKPLKIFEAERFLNISATDKRRAWSRGGTML